MHVCRLHLELPIVVGICPMHSSFFFFYFICMHEVVFNLPWEYHKNSPTDTTDGPCWSGCRRCKPQLSFPSSARGYRPSGHSSARQVPTSIPPPQPTCCSNLSSVARWQAPIEVSQLTFPHATLAASTCALCSQSRKERWPGCPPQVDCLPNDLCGTSWAVALKPVEIPAAISHSAVPSVSPWPSKHRKKKYAPPG